MGRRKDYPWNRRTDKQMTNLVSGLFASFIVAPFAGIDFLPNCDSTPNYNAPLQNNNSSNIKKHKALIRYLSKKTDKNTHLDYVNKIESYKVLKKRLDSLEFKIGLYKAKLRVFGFISHYREKWIKKFKETVTEKRYLEDDYKLPTICLDKYSSSYRGKTNINGHVLLLVNRELKAGGYLEENAICRRIDTNKSLFEVSKSPNAKFSFGSIELFFYDEIMLIMTEDDFVIIDNDAYQLDYRIIDFEGVGVHLPKCSSHWCNVGIIDIKICAQTISLLFFKRAEGTRFFNLIQKHRKQNRIYTDL